MRLGHDLVEVLVLGFRLQVVPGVFDAYVGNRQFEGDDLRPVGGRKAQVHADSVALGGGLAAGDGVILPGGKAGERLAEPGHKIHLDAAIPRGKGPKRSHRTLDLFRLRQHPHHVLRVLLWLPSVFITSIIKCGVVSALKV